MLGLGFIPLIMAYEYIKNRNEYCQEYFIIAVSYIVSLPGVYYDYFIYSHQEGFNFVLGSGVIPFLYRGIIFVSGGFLLIKGFQAIYQRIIHLLNRKEEQ